MKLHSIPTLIPCVIYKLETKPSLNPDGNYNTPINILAKYVSSDDSKYEFQLLELTINNDMILPYPDLNVFQLDTIVTFHKERLSKIFFVSENERI